MAMVTVKVLFFGMSRDLTNSSSAQMEFEEGITVGIFRELILKKYAELKEMKNFAVAINESYAEEEQVLIDSDVLAIIPPVSGG